MSKNLYVTELEPESGMSVVALGIMEFLVRNLDRVALFRPIINTSRQKDGIDKTLHLISTHYGLEIPYEQMYAFTFDEAQSLISEQKTGRLVETILTKYKALESKHDFVLCLGTDFESDSAAFEFELNVDIANNLSCPVLMITDAYESSVDSILKQCKFAIEAFEEKGSSILAMLLNRTPKHLQDKLTDTLRESLQDKVEQIYSIPYEKSLAMLTMSEIVSALDAELMYGHDQLSRLVTRFVVAAMNLRSYLPRITNDDLIITPADRLDIILGTIAAYRSTSMPNIAGMVLTNYYQTDETLQNLLDGAENLVPIIKVEDDTFTAASRIKTIRNYITPDSHRKIATALGLFEANVETTALRKKIIKFSSLYTSPKMFEFGLIKRARADKQVIVLPEGEEDRILQAAEILIQRDAVDIILLGRSKTILNKIVKLGLSLHDIKIIEPSKSSHFKDYSDTYYQLRKHKGITPDNARDVMSGVNHFGTMMVYKGHADGMVSGAVHSTLQTVRPALEFVKTKPDSTIMSGVFFMCLEDRVLAYADCAVNPKPNASQLSEIALETSKTAALFGINPMVAMLSYSSGTSGKGEEVDKVKEATLIAKKLAPTLLIEGPIQYDAAVDSRVARTKMPDSLVAGKATVFIFPDLNTGNNTYKAVQRSAGAVAIGPIMQGLKKPVNDLSRGCLVPDIVNTIAITAIQAQAQKNNNA